MKKQTSQKKHEAEKREYFRLPHEFKLSFKPLEFPLSDRNKKESKVKDVSGGGLLFESDMLYDIGTILQLEINLEGWYRHRSSFFRSMREKIQEPLTVIGEVIRVEKLNDKMYDIGVKFTNVYDDDHVSLIRYIESKKEVKQEKGA